MRLFDRRIRVWLCTFSFAVGFVFFGSGLPRPANANPANAGRPNAAGAGTLSEALRQCMVRAAAVAGGRGFLLPSTAINELEMWQADTFDPVTIDRELGWAAGSASTPCGCSCITCCGNRTEGIRATDGRSLRLPRGIAFVRYSFCSIRAGIRTQSWARNIRRFRECTTRAGCRRRA